MSVKPHRFSFPCLTALLVSAALLCCGICLANHTSDDTSVYLPECKRLEQLPFVPGEKITYQLRWSLFVVGWATLEFDGPVTLNGEEVWKITLNAQTNAFADSIFKVRDSSTVWVDKAFTHPVYYVKQQNEGSTHHDVIVTFDWKKNAAQYSDKGVARKPITVIPGAWDPLAITYAVRSLDLTDVKHLSVPSTDGKKNALTEVNVEPSDNIRTPMGRFNTIVLEPDTKDLGGVFKKSAGAGIMIWFTDDARHLPVRMSSKVSVGKFVAEMTKIEGPGAEAYGKPDDKIPAKP
jgi:hypothetical protein